MFKRYRYIAFLCFIFVFVGVHPQKYDHIFISPHINDAVFSCGGLISKYVNENQKVLVITFYNKQPKSAELPKKFTDYSVRLKEDSVALNYLNVDYIYLNLKERVFISPPIKKLKDVYKSPKNGINGFSRGDSIFYILENFLIKYQDAKFYLPIAAGNNYDNTEIFLSALRLISISNFYHRVYFYEDACVLFGDRIRKKHFVLKQMLYAPKKSPGKTSLRYRKMGKKLSSYIDTKNINNDYISLSLFFDWKLTKVKLSQAEIDNKITAMSKYNSQVGNIGGIKKLKKAVKAYYNFWENKEPLWYIKK